MIDFLRYSAFNVATADSMLGKNPLIFPLSLLSELLEVDRTSSDLALMTTFAREWVAEVTRTAKTKGVSVLVNPATAGYLLEKIAMIDSGILQSEDLKSVARMLRYFVRERNYAFVDNVRNAHSVLELGNVLTKALRDAHVKKARDEPVHIPSEDEIERTLNIAAQNFDQLKTTLALYALSYGSKHDDEPVTMDSHKLDLPASTSEAR